MHIRWFFCLDWLYHEYRSLETRSTLNFCYLLIDGLYATKYLLSFLSEHNIKFECRFHSNRSIKTSDGKKAQVQNHPILKLYRNKRATTVSVEWNGISLLITSYKFRGRDRKYRILYLASNIENTSAKEHADIYKKRWPIEKMFRTVKQSLGLTHCSARTLKKHRQHIFAVFYGYASLQVEAYSSELDHPEAALKALKYVKTSSIKRRISRFSRNFSYVA